MTAEPMAPASPIQTAQWLATVYAALALRSSEVIGDDYVRAIRDRVVRRAEGHVTPEAVATLIAEKLSDLRNGDGKRVLGDAVRELAERNEPHVLRQFLLDLVDLALHDDWYAHEEGRFISAVARRWNLHPADDDRTRLWSVMSSQLTEGQWTALHDLAVVYIALAHQSDDDLVQREIDAISRKLAEWLPAALPEDVSAIVGEALHRYAADDPRPLLSEAISRLKVSVPSHQRAAIFADLEYIARADDVLLVEEKAIIAELASAWGTELADL